MLDSLFSGFNPIKKKNLEDEFMPDQKDLDFLQRMIDAKRESQVTKKDMERVEKLEDDLNEILEYNIGLYDKYGDDVDENDYRLIVIPNHIHKILKDAQDSLGAIFSGGVRNYKKSVMIERINEQPFGTYQAREQEMMLLYPEDFNRKLKPKGNWVMVSEDVNCESAPEKYEIYYATPLAKPCTVFGENVKRWYASIISNNKEVLLEPREYVIVPDANQLLEAIGNGVEMIEGSASARLDKNKVFYLKSRGFNQAEIYQILFKSITNKGFCHFKVDPYLCDIFEDIKGGHSPNMAIKIHEHMRNLPNFKFEKQC